MVTINLLRAGPLSIAIPGELRGLQEAKAKYGNPDISFGSLLEPSIQLLRDGVEITSSLASAIDGNHDFIDNDPGLG